MTAKLMREEFINERFLTEFFGVTGLQTKLTFRGGERKAASKISNEKRQRP